VPHGFDFLRAGAALPLAEPELDRVSLVNLAANDDRSMEKDIVS